eukprot:scaffold324202_cov52-Tisochrysis_lutea.AAC.2
MMTMTIRNQVPTCNIVRASAWRGMRWEVLSYVRAPLAFTPSRELCVDQEGEVIRWEIDMWGGKLVQTRPRWPLAGAVADNDAAHSAMHTLIFVA